MNKQQPGDYVRLGDWVEQARIPAIPNRASADWMIKQHRGELVAAGALIPARGRSGSLVHRDLFPQTVIDILTREAQKREAA